MHKQTVLSYVLHIMRLAFHESESVPVRLDGDLLLHTTQPCTPIQPLRELQTQVEAVLVCLRRVL